MLSFLKSHRPVAGLIHRRAGALCWLFAGCWLAACSAAPAPSWDRDTSEPAPSWDRDTSEPYTPPPTRQPAWMKAKAPAAAPAPAPAPVRPSLHCTAVEVIPGTTSVQCD